MRLNVAVAAVAAIASVLRVITEQSAEPEIRQVAEQALQSTGLASLFDAGSDHSR